MKTLSLILSVMMTTSVAFSIPALHKNTKTAHKAHTEIKPVVAENISAKQSPVKHQTQPPAGTGASRLSPDVEQGFLEYARVANQSLSISEKGDADAKKGDWVQAQKYYEQALTIWPDSSAALYGMGQCADAAGDSAGAVKYYRTATYADNSPHSIDNAQTNDPVRLMEFVLLLHKAGQEQEALSVYRRAAKLLNYIDGKQNLYVLLPDFRPGEWAYTPHRLAAMAHVGIAYAKDSLDNKLIQVELQKAMDLAPDSPVPYFYKGRSLIGKGGRSREMQAAFNMAAQLGDDDTKAVVDKQMRDYSVDHDAQIEQEMADMEKNKAPPKK